MCNGVWLDSRGGDRCVRVSSHLRAIRLTFSPRFSWSPIFLAQAKWSHLWPRRINVRNQKRLCSAAILPALATGKSHTIFVDTLRC